jgi:hypothetical protein
MLLSDGLAVNYVDNKGSGVFFSPLIDLALNVGRKPG